MASKEKRILVAYLTIPDTLAQTSQKLAEVTGGYLFPLEPAAPYLPRDFKPDRPRSRTRWEAKTFRERPAIRNRIYFMDDFFKIYLGFTHWWYGIPRLIQSFLEEYDFTDKCIIPFTTSGTPGAEELTERVTVLSEAYPIPYWLPLTILKDNITEEELREWVATLPRRTKKRRSKGKICES